MKSDDELAQIINEQDPSEIGEAELEAIRARLGTSAVIREAVKSRLELDQGLVQLLAPVNVNLQAILQQDAKARRGPWLAMLAAVVAVVAIGGGLWFVVGGPQAEKSRPDAGSQVATINQVAEVKPGDQLPAAQNGGGIEVNSAQGGRAGNADGLETISSSRVEQSGETPVAMSPASAGTSQAEPGTMAVAAAGQSVPTPAAPNTEPKPAVANVWDDALGPKSKVWPARSERWVDWTSDRRLDEIGETTFRKWFRVVPGQNLEVFGEQSGRKRVLRVTGQAELVAPWVAGARWRFSMYDIQHLQLGAWHGGEGHLLKFYPHHYHNVWGAYAASRQGNDGKPVPKKLLATDGSAYARSRFGIFDLMWQEGELLLLKGELVLMRVPCLEQPEQLTIGGEFRLRGFAVDRCEPVVLPSNPSREVELIAKSPAELDWKFVEAQPEAIRRIDRGDDGSVVCSGKWQGGATHCYVPTSSHKLVEYIAHVEASNVGAGLYLGNDKGEPLIKLGFHRDQHLQQTMVALVHPHDNRDNCQYDAVHHIIPLAGERTWVKLALGLDRAHFYISPDGERWSYCGDQAYDYTGQIRTAGLWFGPHNEERTIRLHELRVRRYRLAEEFGPSPTTLPAVELTAAELTDRYAWETRCKQEFANASERDRDVWMAVLALDQGANRSLGSYLWEVLGPRISEQLARGDAGKESGQYAHEVFEELGWLVPNMDDQNFRRFISWVGEWGLGQLHHGIGPTGGTKGESRVDAAAKRRDAVYRLIAKCSINHVTEWKEAIERWERAECMAALFEKDWAAERRCAQEVRYFSWQLHPDWRPHGQWESMDQMADLVLRLSREYQGDPSTVSVGLPLLWRHPLVLPRSKEAYSWQAELNAALKSESAREAARVISGLKGEELQELLVDWSDPHLSCSLEVLLERTLAEHGSVGHAIRSEFAPLGAVRLKQSIAAGNLQGVTATRFQFPQTASAAEGAMWLGDRAISLGDYLVAGHYYAKAWPGLAKDRKQGLLGRMVLAYRQMNGDRAVEAALDRPFSAAALAAGSATEAITKALHDGSDTSAVDSSESADPRTKPTFQIGRYKAETLFRFEGPAGGNTSKHEYAQSDAMGLQMAISAGPDQIVVGNRFELVAWDANAKQVVWNSQSGGETDEAHSYQFEPSKPLERDGLLIWRRLSKSHSELVGTERETGKIKWRFHPKEGVVLGQPLLFGDEVHCIAADRGEEHFSDLRYVRLETATGKERASRPLFTFRNVCDGKLPCAMLATDDGTYVSLAGVTMLVDRVGEVRWLRRHVRVPWPIDDLRYRGASRDPLLLQAGLCVAAEGGRTVSMLKPATGELIWETVVPELHGVVGGTADLVLAATSTGVVALDGTTGEVRWSYEIPQRLELFHAGDGSLCVGVRLKTGPDAGKPALVWLNTATGAELAVETLAGEFGTEAVLSGLTHTPQGWVISWANHWSDPQRQIARLVPQGS
jgi:PQQ-like domain